MRPQPLIAGIEIGGTKLQLAVAAADAPATLVDQRRFTIDRARGARGILSQIEQGIAELRQHHAIECLGIGFGGPVHTATGHVITSHQVDGWDDFPLEKWCQEHLTLRAHLGNDCNVAALAEAHLGAGRGRRRMLYVTVGTGIGGGMIIDGRIDGAERPAIAEVGHLRPGIAARDAHDTVESRASGLGIETIVRRALSQQPPQLAASDWEDLTTRCQGDFSRLTTHMLSLAAADGNRFASQSLEQAAQTLGWALAQATTLLAPERIVLGGGVAMIGERYFEAVDRWRNEYGFPPLQGTCDLVPAALGEQVVVHGAVLLASTAS